MSLSKFPCSMTWKLHYQFTCTTRSLAFVMQSMQHIVLYDFFFFFFIYIIDKFLGMCIIDHTSFYYPLIKSYKLLSQAKPLQQQKLAKNLGNYFLMIICILYIKLFSYQDTVRPHQLQDL